MQNQEQDQNKMKKQSSYHYWHSKVPQSSIPINTAPQKIQTPIQSSSEPSKTGPSTWNSSGTWEERKIPLKQFDEKLSSVLVGKKTLKEEASILSVSTEGEASLIFTRGKKSLTYDLKITIEFKGQNEYEDCSATLKFEQFTDHGDRQYSLKCQNGSKKEAIKQSVKNQISRIIKEIEGQLNQYKQL